MGVCFFFFKENDVCVASHFPESSHLLTAAISPQALRRHSCANTLQKAGDGGRYRCHRPLTQAAFVCVAGRRPAGMGLLGPSLTPRNTGKSMRTHNCLLAATIGPFISSLLSFCCSSDLFLHCSRPVGTGRLTTHTKDKRVHFRTFRISRKCAILVFFCSLKLRLTPRVCFGLVKCHFIFLPFSCDVTSVAPPTVTVRRHSRWGIDERGAYRKKELHFASHENAVTDRTGRWDGAATALDTHG